MIQQKNFQQKNDAKTFIEFHQPPFMFDEIPPKLYFMDTGLAAYLTKWTNPEVMQNGAMSGAFFETYAVAEVIKSFANKGLEPPIYFYRDKDKIEIGLLIEQNGTVFHIEIKKSKSRFKRCKKFFYHIKVKKRQNRTERCPMQHQQRCFPFKKWSKCHRSSNRICIVEFFSSKIKMSKNV